LKVPRDKASRRWKGRCGWPTGPAVASDISMSRLIGNVTPPRMVQFDDLLPFVARCKTKNEKDARSGTGALPHFRNPNLPTGGTPAHVAGPERRARKRTGLAKAAAAQGRLIALVERGIAAVVVDALSGIGRAPASAGTHCVCSRNGLPDIRTSPAARSLRTPPSLRRASAPKKRRRANKCGGFSLELAEDSCPALAAPGIPTVGFGLEPPAK